MQHSYNYFQKQETREQADEAQNISLKQILLQLLGLSELNPWNAGGWKDQGFKLGPSRDILAWKAQEFECF